MDKIRQIFVCLCLLSTTIVIWYSSKHSLHTPHVSHWQAKRFENDDNIYKHINATDYNVNSGLIGHKYRVVIFTSFYNRSDRDVIQRNVLKNMASLGPRVRKVLFDIHGKGPLKDEATVYGWDIIHYDHVNKFGTPFLKEMYEIAMAKYDSDFYGFANGDILWSDTFVKAFDDIVSNIKLLNATLVIGTKRNLVISENTFNLYEPRKVGTVHASLEPYRQDAEDFFFVTRGFSFSRLKHVVVGRAAYDNYLVGIANQSPDILVIDASKSLQALHISTAGLHHGDANSDAHYNTELIGNFSYLDGLINKAGYVVKVNGKGQSFIAKRRGIILTGQTGKKSGDIKGCINKNPTCIL